MNALRQSVAVAVVLLGLSTGLLHAQGGIPIEQLLGEEPDPMRTAPGARETSAPADRQPTSQPAGRRDTTKSPVISPRRATGVDEARLAELRRGGRNVPVIPPEGPARVEKAPAPGKEGHAVIRRKATVGREGDDSPWLVAHLAGAATLDSGSTRRLLPNRLLGEIEKVLAERPNAVFRLSGETTVFEDKAYLLIRRATVMTEDAPAAQQPPKNDEPTPTAANRQVPTSKPATEPAYVASDNTDGAPSADEMMAGLLAQGTADRTIRTSAVPEKTSEENKTSVAPAGRDPAKGTSNLVIDRIVRILPDDEEDSWYVARFETDNTLRDPPMRILPNAMLARALQLNSQLGKREMKFRVTGEVTWHHKQRYLLLRRVIAHRDMGQF